MARARWQAFALESQHCDNVKPTNPAKCTLYMYLLFVLRALGCLLSISLTPVNLFVVYEKKISIKTRLISMKRVDL